MPRHPISHPSTLADQPAPVAKRSPTATLKPSVLKAHQRVLFAQRLALLIDRIRAATREDAPDER